mmetsp:Transcript_144764/g.403379  ORF Transcript_144764/g.403379 Transcript_144764/m.403379 type:complete len:247 (+) Transcript_144764:349-1089(+)
MGLAQGVLNGGPHLGEFRLINGLRMLDGQVLDLPHEPVLLKVGEHQKTCAGVAGTGRTPQAVHIRLTVRRHAALQDKRHVWIVESARRDVAGNEDALGGLPELLGGPLAVTLTFPRVDLDAPLLEDPCICQRIEDSRKELCGPSDRQKDDNLVVRLPRMLPQDAHCGRYLLLQRSHKAGLRDAMGGHLLLADCIDHQVLPLSLPKRNLGYGIDLFRECGGEEQRLPSLLGGQHPEYLVNLRAEAHV